MDSLVFCMGAKSGFELAPGKKDEKKTRLSRVMPAKSKPLFVPIQNTRESIQNTRATTDRTTMVQNRGSVGGLLEVGGNLIYMGFRYVVICVW